MLVIEQTDIVWIPIIIYIVLGKLVSTTFWHIFRPFYLPKNWLREVKKDNTGIIILMTQYCQFAAVAIKQIYEFKSKSWVACGYCRRMLCVCGNVGYFGPVYLSQGISLVLIFCCRPTSHHSPPPPPSPEKTEEGRSKLFSLAKKGKPFFVAGIGWGSDAGYTVCRYASH